MGRKALVWGGGLIALYLALKNFTGASKDATAASNGTVGIVKAFQGR